jgi:hypothetical protein
LAIACRAKADRSAAEARVEVITGATLTKGRHQLRPTGLASTTINGVNDVGDIIGLYTSPSDAVIGFVGTPVPEPSTWA